LQDGVHAAFAFLDWISDVSDRRNACFSLARIRTSVAMNPDDIGFDTQIRTAGFFDAENAWWNPNRKL
jgi:hypothetical protein